MKRMAKRKRPRKVTQVEPFDLFNKRPARVMFVLRSSSGRPVYVEDKRPMPSMKPVKVNILGMELDEWRHKSCLAHIAANEDWATVYDIQSQDEGKGHATELLLILKSYYKGKRFGGSVALNDRMRRLYKKCEITEYTEMEF